jgi:hypothetical protein
MRIAAPIGEEVLSIFLAQSIYEGVSVFFADATIAVAMAIIEVVTHLRLRFRLGVRVADGPSTERSIESPRSVNQV